MEGRQNPSLFPSDPGLEGPVVAPRHAEALYDLRAEAVVQRQCRRNRAEAAEQQLVITPAQPPISIL